MRKIERLILGGLLAGGLAGCISPTPVLDSRFGDSVNIIKARQTLDPQASRNDSPVSGLDGKAARGALENYRDSFRTPPAESGTTIQLNLGGGQR